MRSDIDSHSSKQRTAESAQYKEIGDYSFNRNQKDCKANESRSIKEPLADSRVGENISRMNEVFAMAALHFIYSTMNVGKSTALLQASHGYRERGPRRWFLPHQRTTSRRIRSGIKSWFKITSPHLF